MAGLLTMREIVITAAAALCAFVTALVFVLRMSSRRPPPLWTEPPYGPPRS